MEACKRRAVSSGCSAEPKSLSPFKMLGGGYLELNIFKLAGSLISNFQTMIIGDGFMEALNAPSCSQVKESCAVSPSEVLGALSKQVMGTLRFS